MGTGRGNVSGPARFLPRAELFFSLFEAAVTDSAGTSSRLGAPVSTTHVVSPAVRWGIARRIVAAWVATIPGRATPGWVVDAVPRPIAGER